MAKGHYEAPFYFLFSIYWYQEIDFLISRNDFLISKIRFLDIKKCVLFFDIKKSNSWYKEKYFLISGNVFLDIKKSNSWYQELLYK